MKRLAVLFAVLALVACRTNEELATAQADLFETAVAHWATVLAPTPLPVPPATVPPATATANAALEYLRAEEVAYNVREAERRLNLTRTPLASPGPATIEAVLATVERVKAEAQFFADYWATRTAPTATPVPPTATRIPPTLTATRLPGERPVIDLNTASEQDMANLPANVDGDRLGLARAQRIGIFREQFTIIELDDLIQIVGIGEQTVFWIRNCDCTVQR